MLKKLLPFLLCSTLWGGSLIEDLEIAAFWDRKMEERLPVSFNHLLSTGYFTTHSARMAKIGEFGVGGAMLYPYRHLNFHFQPFTHLELSANYRIFCGIEDNLLSKKGFGNYADRGANIKLSLATPEDSCNALPGIALGIDDFMGSKKFTTYYLVGTQVFINYGTELSLGWGTGRYSRGPSRGFFGAIEWYPFFSCDDRWTKGFSLALEYDPTNYKKDPHPKARKAHTQITPGIKYNFSDQVNLSASYIRGDAFALAGSLHCHWGGPNGLFPKLKDPPYYCAPREGEPLGCTRTERQLMEKLAHILLCQGFHLTKGWLDQGHLTIQVINCRYRYEAVVRTRLQHVLAALLPCNIEVVTLIIESYGAPIQQYVYAGGLLKRYHEGSIGPYEFDLLTPRVEASFPKGSLIYSCRPELWRFRPSPLFETFLGNASGKFKYDLGLRTAIDGFLPGNFYYEAMASYTFLTTTKDVSDCDAYNPSQLPNVLTDYVNYRRRRILAAERLYLQKNLNWGRGWFASIAGGYFQINYAGLSGEVVWYPAHSCLALGVEGAVLKKRKYTGLGFQNRLRQFKGRRLTFKPYDTLQQYFFNVFFDIPDWQMSSKLSVGGFLAHDKGARFELSRYFESGIRVTGWVTVTNAYDHVNGKRYYNRGIAFEMPLDFFFQCSSRRVWNHGMAAWLRDAGAFIPTGRSLIDIINRERRN